MSKKYKKAFVLTELLIVISVIGVVASFVFVVIGGRRAQGRDTKRYAEVDTLRMGLEYYYYDNKEYPESPEWIKIEEDEDVGGLFSQAMKNPQYLPQIPRDPLYGKNTEAGDPYSYQYKSTEDKSGYKIHIELEGGGFYEIYSVGGEELVYGGVGPAAPIIVGTTSSNEGLLGPTHWKSFYANGRFWVWYCTDDDWGYKSSTDGSNWSDFTTAGTCFLSEGWHVAVFFDGTYVHSRTSMVSSDLLYRRGTPNSDGSITWSTGPQTVHNGSIFDRHDEGTIAVDSAGYAFIYDKRFQFFSNTPYVWKNAANTGVWVTDDGFPYQLNTTNGQWRGLIVPLTNGKMYAIYAINNSTIRGRLWNGNSWEEEETDVADYSVAEISGLGGSMSATVKGDDIYFAYLRATTHQVRFNKRVYGTGWQTNDELVQNSVTSRSAPVISMDTSTGDSYVFWTASPVANHIYYKKRTSGGVWDCNPTDWIDESTDGLTRNDQITGYFKDYGARIGLIYMTGSSSPYNIKFEAF